MTNVALVAKKLAILEEHLTRLRARRPEDVEAFKRDALLQDAVALSVLVVVQEAMDIALHVASDEGWELAATYREAFSVLEKHGIIGAELARALAGAAQLRNRIAHGYATLDTERLWLELPEGIRTFDQFARAIAQHITTVPEAK